VDYYDIRTFIPYSVPNEPTDFLTPGLEIFLETVKKGTSFDINSPKMLKSYNVSATRDNGKKVFYNIFNSRVMNAHWKLYFKIN